jgi:hypothetical protein
MKKLGVAIAIVAITVFFYKLKYPTYTYRYRMTVEVDAGGEIRSGSSVIEANVSRQPQILPEFPPYERWARGQAVFVELPGEKNIVALLASGATGEHSDYPLELIPRVFKVAVENLPSFHGRRELMVDQMPTLITVTNPSEAKTARIVKPNDLEVLGGHLRSISVEMTTDPISTINLDSRLPFLINEEKRWHEIVYPNVFSPRYSIFVRR